MDTAPVMEKPLARARRPRLAGQAHQPGVAPRTAPGCSSARSSARCPLPPDPPEADHCGSCRRCLAHLPDRRLPRALPPRCAALHLLPHDRARGPDPGGVPRADGQPHLRLRRLPRRLPLEQVRPGAQRTSLRAARRTDRAAPGRTRRAGRCRLPRPVHRQPGEAHRPRPLRAQRAGRHRQLGRPRAARRRAGARRTIRTPWSPTPRAGRPKGSPRHDHRRRGRRARAVQRRAGFRDLPGLGAPTASRAWRRSASPTASGTASSSTARERVPRPPPRAVPRLGGAPRRSAHACRSTRSAPFPTPP